MEGPSKGPSNPGKQKEKVAETSSTQEIMSKLTQIKQDVSDFQQVLPFLLDYLKHSCKLFKAGQGAKHVDAGLGITIRT